jgi:phosphoglycolate phosphatase
MRSIIWDWNGTLLNDLDLCVSTINVLLKKRNLTLLNSKTYKAVFSFPVKDYYEAVGFDFAKEDFAIPANEFIDLYDNKVKTCALHPFAEKVLSHFKSKGIRQFVLSAMKHDMLEATLKHNGIFHFFEGVAGLNDHYAVSKIERGNQLIDEFNIQKNDSWMIGDTIHDFEVAEELGTKCILIADGHQSASRLKSTGAPVIFDLQKLVELKSLEDLIN